MEGWVSHFTVKGIQVGHVKQGRVSKPTFPSHRSTPHHYHFARPFRPRPPSPNLPHPLFPFSNAQPLCYSLRCHTSVHDFLSRLVTTSSIILLSSQRTLSPQTSILHSSRIAHRAALAAAPYQPCLTRKPASTIVCSTKRTRPDELPHRAYCHVATVLRNPRPA